MSPTQHIHAANSNHNNTNDHFSTRQPQCSHQQLSIAPQNNITNANDTTVIVNITYAFSPTINTSAQVDDDPQNLYNSRRLVPSKIATLRA